MQNQSPIIAQADTLCNSQFGEQVVPRELESVELLFVGGGDIINNNL
jgi:hypothetical protein